MPNKLKKEKKRKKKKEKTCQKPKWPNPMAFPS
jgi:hypothetical protein